MNEMDWTSSSEAPTTGGNSNGVVPKLALILAIAPFSVAHGPGSGGLVTAATFQARSAWVSGDSSGTGLWDVAPRPPSVDTQPSSLQQRLEALKGDLGLTVTDMAELFGVARPSIYAWLKGQEPRPENVERLADFEVAAKAVSGLQLPRLGKLVKRPLKSGTSLFLLIKQGAPLEAALAELRETARVEAAQRRSEKGRHDLMASSDAAGLYSTKAVRKDS
ncbi:helix-turn-helix transcriptional regulator [Alcanivorax sp. ZXX171]|nr:helix-turn-helix transcriptional regulator [Alcanivorax sp. ZXX171]